GNNGGSANGSAGTGGANSAGGTATGGSAGNGSGGAGVNVVGGGGGGGYVGGTQGGGSSGGCKGAGGGGGGSSWALSSATDVSFGTTGTNGVSVVFALNPIVSVPAPPTIGSATAGDGSATVNWTAPSYDGGTPLIGYVVTPYIGATAQPPHVFGTTATSQVITGLANGTTYTFQVAAQNGVGVGASSLSSNAVTPAPPLTAPSAPTIGTATAGDGQATLTWSAPSSNGGSAVIGYLVTPYIGATAQTAQLFGSVATAETIVGLANASTYTFRVAALNVIGTGPQSAASNAVTPVANVSVPSAPTIGAAVAGNQHATVAWSAPSSNGGGPLTGYVVTPYVGATAQPTHTFGPSAVVGVISGLVNGTSYTFTVAATNATGTGNQSAATNAVVPVTVPDAPAIGGVIATNHQATVTWTAPAYDGSTPITGYVVTPFIGGVAQPAHTFDTDDTSQSVGGLTNSATYTFTVAAINAAGTGGVSDQSDPVTPVAWYPFPTGLAFIKQQFHDFAGRAPTSAEITSWTNSLVNGTKAPEQLIDSLRTASYWEPTLGPIIRLYSAYFLRNPDTGGLTFWLGKFRGGESLADISQFFSKSAEFKARYGALDNTGFVNFVYLNVLDRLPDAAGGAFWVGRLDAKVTRGRVMIGFSNSDEYAAQQAKVVAVIDLYYGLLGVVPNPTVTSDDVARLVGGTSLSTITTEILDSPAYATRVL
ncbi:MAG TPA: fibronectin type III domain-containing protein, partial [Acidimicrobiales bacterium]